MKVKIRQLELQVSKDSKEKKTSSALKDDADSEAAVGLNPLKPTTVSNDSVGNDSVNGFLKCSFVSSV